MKKGQCGLRLLEVNWKYWRNVFVLRRGVTFGERVAVGKHVLFVNKLLVVVLHILVIFADFFRFPQTLVVLFPKFSSSDGFICVLLTKALVVAKQ